MLRVLPQSLLLACLVISFLPLLDDPAVAQRSLGGTSVAQETDQPTLGEWKYCITVAWDTETTWALSHLDVVLGLSGCTCVCEGFSFAAPDTAGFSSGGTNGDSCTVYYYALFSCDGDPSIPGLDAPLVKFEPYENHCAPDVAGIGTFCFYSDWPPVAIASPDSMLAVKFDQADCFGDLTGELPGCAFPSEAGSSGWGSVKRRYR